jgi:hypothetical protein
LEIAKVIGHNVTYSGRVQFLCQWKDYLPEDATYRAAEDIQRPDTRILVAKYISQLDIISDDLKTWMDLNPWSTQTKPATVPKSTPASVLAAYIPTALDQGTWYGVWDVDMEMEMDDDDDTDGTDTDGMDSDGVMIKMEEDDEMDSLQRREGVELF